MAAFDETFGTVVLSGGGPDTSSQVRRHSAFDTFVAGSQYAMQSAGGGTAELETLGRFVPSGGLAQEGESPQLNPLRPCIFARGGDRRCNHGKREHK
jgi:hypothetical protein